MTHIYLSMVGEHPRDNGIIDEIIGLSGHVGLVQAAAADDQLTREVAEAHIAACEGMLALVTGLPADKQTWRSIPPNDSAFPSSSSPTEPPWTKSGTDR